MDWGPSTLPSQKRYRGEYYIPISFLKKKSTVQCGIYGSSWLYRAILVTYMYTLVSIY